jgi:chromosome segregation ATPase
MAKKPRAANVTELVPVTTDVVMVTELTDNDIAVAKVKLPLDTVIIRDTIKGPDVTSLFRKMDLPGPDTGGNEDDGVSKLLDQIDIKAKELQEARDDHNASKAYSTNIQLMTAHHLKKVEIEHDELNMHLMKKKPALTTPDTFAKADKLRSVAVENFEKWTSAAKSKHEAIVEEISTAEAAADEAIDALQKQKDAIKCAFDTHAAAWKTRNEAVEAKHRDKITALETHCRNLGPSKAANDSKILELKNPNAAGSQADIVQESASSDIKELKHALDEARTMLSTQKEMIEAAAVRYKEMEARIAFLTAPTMDAEEQATRLALRSAILESKDIGKGKGKGSDVPAASPGQVY